jgi:archaemetzincin
MARARQLVVALAPMGGASPEDVAALRPDVAHAYRCQAVVTAAIPLPSRAYDPRRRQHHSTLLLDTLAGLERGGWKRVLGVADVDLYVPELNFVFGEADPARGVAVMSLARLRAGAEDPLFRRRAATEAIHELGHTWGLRHCGNPRCVMWFSNTLAESDRKGTAFCHRHAIEIQRVIAE